MKTYIPLWILAIALLTAAFLENSGNAVGTPAVLDQSLTGNPACNSTNFRATASSTGAIRQEFVPEASDLVVVALCLNVSPNTLINLNVRGGTVASPGSILATTSTTTGPSTNGTQWISFSLPAPLTTTPGTKLVLELPSSETVAWRGTCAELVGNCVSVDSDLYPSGVSSVAYVGDFAFQTYTGLPSTATPTSTASPTASPTSTPVPVHHRATATPTPTVTRTPAPPTTAPTAAVLPTLRPSGGPAGVIVAPPNTGGGP